MIRMIRLIRIMKIIRIIIRIIMIIALGLKPATARPTKGKRQPSKGSS